MRYLFPPIGKHLQTPQRKKMSTRLEERSEQYRCNSPRNRSPRGQQTLDSNTSTLGGFEFGRSVYESDVKDEGNGFTFEPPPTKTFDWTEDDLNLDEYASYLYPFGRNYIKNHTKTEKIAIAAEVMKCLDKTVLRKQINERPKNEALRTIYRDICRMCVHGILDYHSTWTKTPKDHKKEISQFVDENYGKYMEHSRLIFK